jgi:hypothetical protein
VWSARWLPLHGATQVAVPQGLRDGLPALLIPRASRSPVANDKKGRETLCKYILRPSLANDLLKRSRTTGANCGNSGSTRDGSLPPPAGYGLTRIWRE